MSEDRKRSANPSEAAVERAFEWLTLLHSGHARAADWTAYQAWRCTSRDNEAAAREAESLWDIIPDAYADAAEAPSATGRRRSWAWRATAVGALAAAAIALLLWMPPLERLQADYATEVAELQQITLPDASRLTLDGATAVNADFSDEARRLRLLDGRLYTEVAPDEGRPFTVDAGGLRMTALGTAFTVTRAGERTSLVVEEHAVRVALQHGPETAARTVQGGEKLVYTPGKQMRVMEADLANVAAWRERLLIFRAKPLSAVVSDLRRHVPQAIWVLDPGLAELKVTGLIDLAHPDRAVQRLEQLLPVQAYRLPGLIVLRGR